MVPFRVFDQRLAISPADSNPRYRYDLLCPLTVVFRYFSAHQVRSPVRVVYFSESSCEFVSFRVHCRSCVSLWL